MPPPSAPTGSNSSLGPVTLPLFKLSHCTISGPGARMLWTHLPNRDDMFAVFDQVRSTEVGGVVISKQVLKLVRGGELLETVDFDSLKHQARLDQQRAQSQAVPDELLYVVIVTKRPLLALRYRLPDGQIRRLQMNFQPPSGYDTTLEFLKPLGLPLRVKSGTEQPQPPTQRPYSAQSGPNVPSSHSQESKSVPVGPCNDMPTSVQAPQVRSAPNSQNDPDVFSKPISYIQDPRVQRPQTGSSNGSSVYYNPVSRPVSSSTALGFTDETRMAPPAFRRLLPSPTFSNQSAYLGGFDSRPISAPEPPSEYSADTTVFSQLLPPARELPFPKKPEHHDNKATPVSSGESMVIREHPDQATKARKKRAPAKSKSRVSRSTSKISASPPKARTKKAKTEKTGSRHCPPSSAPPEERSTAQVFCNEGPSSSAPPKMTSTLEALEQTVSRMSKNFTPPPSRSGTETSKKRPLSAIDDKETNKRQATTKTAVSKEIEQAVVQETAPPPNPILANINPEEVLDSLDGWIRKYHNLPVPVPKPPAIAKDQLAEYAAKSDEERAEIIDNMICECLQDENFGKLVDDVEGHWKRICLGF